MLTTMVSLKKKQKKKHPGFWQPVGFQKPVGPQFSPLQKGLSLLLLIRTTVGVTSHLITWWCSENRTSTLWGRWGTHWPGCSDCYYSRYCRLTGDHESNQTCLSGGSCEGSAAVKWDHKALWHLGMCVTQVSSTMLQLEVPAQRHGWFTGGSDKTMSPSW